MTWPPRISLWQAVALALLLALAWQTARIEGFSVFGIGPRGYKGQLADIRLDIERDKAAQREREAGAAIALHRAEMAAQAAAAERTKEMSDAIDKIPDQALSARQRAILCVELSRQAKANGGTIAACEPAGARP